MNVTVCTGAENTHFVRASITVWLTSCLTGLDLVEEVNLLSIKHKQRSDTSTYEVSECSLFKSFLVFTSTDDQRKAESFYKSRQKIC